MDSDRIRTRLFRPIQTFPIDLAAIVVVGIAINLVVLTPVVSSTWVLVPLGLTFALFVPGYTFVAALFPERGTGPTEGNSERTEIAHEQAAVDSARSRISGLERVVLSITLSVSIVPLVGFVLNATPWGLRLIPSMVAISGITLALLVIALIRRWNLEPEKRLQVPYRNWYAAVRTEFVEPATRADAALNVLVVIAIVVAASSVGYAVISTTHDEQFSAVYLLTEDDDGEQIADDYPTEFEHGESQELIVGIDNHEYRPVNYTVVVLEQDIGTNGNEMITEEQREIDRFEIQLSHDETERFQYDLEPTIIGTDIRIVWLVYQNEVPPAPSIENAPAETHLWVDVHN
ncbi:hypothetical protein B2G88_06575 [Natronolimnobius baerhuensis]|uniref:DUF1616 domain-containing protein n=1 Tax=Natronolimnobius baerhuensis TaxID=253108 RepID=A0A202EA95_9EURY|nr:hypothetical protein B2G88_06575 [Natronolimnobius baerhuensis]